MKALRGLKVDIELEGRRYRVRTRADERTEKVLRQIGLTLLF